MKKLLPVVALLSGIIFWVSCNKGDDNPYGDWRCTCFVTKYVYLPPADTVKTIKLDTVYLNADQVDKNTAKSFCEQSQKGYTDTMGGSAKCIIK